MTDIKAAILNMKGGLGKKRALVLLFAAFACLIVFDAAFAARKKTVRPRKQTVDQRVYLQHADELMYDAYGSHPDAQFVKGNVAFMHKGMHLTCDSAYFYEESNSFEAFGNVHMWQGDTLSLVSDYAYYDETAQQWTLRGHVHALNLKGEQFDTEELIWQQKTHRIFSDSSIIITRAKNIIEGVGFDSNEDMSKYTILNPTGVFPIEDE